MLEGSSRRAGFTLLEIVIVLSVLVVLAGVVLSGVGTVEQDARTSLAQRQLYELRDALRRFEADMGFLPGQGPLALDDGTGGPGRVKHSLEPGGPPSGFTSIVEWRDWASSPANVYQLVEPPLSEGAAGVNRPTSWMLTGAVKDLATWSPERGRGWRGPYLSQSAVAWVTIGFGIAADSSGTPDFSADPPRVLAVPDLFPHEPGPEPFNAHVYAWHSSFPATALEERRPCGRPILIFDLAKPTARLVSMGPNGDMGVPTGAYTPYAPYTPSNTLDGPVDSASDDQGVFLR
ncbi:MAG: prepilin-type N-terminal cleavage/methylation domain-containing protein [Planctomycetota bacterium]